MQKMLFKCLGNIYCLSLFSFFQEKNNSLVFAVKYTLAVTGLGISGLQRGRDVLCSSLLVTYRIQCILNS